MITYLLSVKGDGALRKYKVVVCKTPNGKPLIEKFFKELDNKNKHDDLKQIKLYIDKLEEFGMDINKEFSPNAIKPLRDGIYELRPGNNRICFFIFKDDKNKFVLLNGFTKKRQSTHKKEIDLAIKAMKNYKKEKKQ